MADRLPARESASHRRLAVPAAALAALWLAALTVGAGPLDGELLSALYVGGNGLLVSIARGFTFLGEWWLVVGLSIAGAAWLWASRGWRYGLAVLLVTLIGRSLVSAQKYAVLRLRPEIHEHLVPVSTPSFPSGHAAGATIVYLTLALVLTAGTRWKWPTVAAAIGLALGVGLSRIMLGVHYPTDVVGGWAFGLLWVLLALPWAERLASPRDRD